MTDTGTESEKIDEKKEQENEVIEEKNIKTEDIAPDNKGSKEKTHEEKLKEIDDLCEQIYELNAKPILILYYPPDEMAKIISPNIRYIYNILYNGTNGKVINELNVIIHTYGGDPNTSYRIIQAIRELANKVNILVPSHSYSGGTLICLGANKIFMGAYAALSPIDITATTTDQDISDGKYDEVCGDGPDQIHLICIDKYIEFTQHCKNIIERYDCGDKTKKVHTKIEEVLLGKFIDEVGAVNIADIFRERELTKTYASILLKSYMYPGEDNKKLVDNICDLLVYKFPSHGFQIDLNIAKNELNLNAERMDTDLSNKTKALISKLDKLYSDNEICLNFAQKYKMPYVKYYDKGENNEQNPEGNRHRNPESDVPRDT
jgi:hypothetical protein